MPPFVPKSDAEPIFGRMAGVKPREATAEGGAGLTPANPTESTIGNRI